MAQIGKIDLFFASDYFEAMYECAVKLIKKGKAYVCDLTAEADQRIPWDIKRTGKEQSIQRSAAVEENLELFEAMK